MAAVGVIAHVQSSDQMEAAQPFLDSQQQLIFFHKHRVSSATFDGELGTFTVEFSGSSTRADRQAIADDLRQSHLFTSVAVASLSQQ